MSRSEESAQQTLPRNDALIGAVLSGRFRIVEWLGAGPLGNVYKAIQEPLGRLVAVKVFNPSAAEDQQTFRARFLREISLIAKLGHPNTVKVIDYGESEGVLYVAMEYLSGGSTLAELLRQKHTYPWRSALLLAQSVGRPLREAHRLGVLHRDLKPANIMVLNGEDFESVKVLDFGMVKPFAEGPGADLASAGFSEGTLARSSSEYLAPEQARNYADARSDIYALGIILYEMIAGVRPFATSEAMPRFDSVKPGLGVPQRLENAIARCLQIDPEKRFANLDEMLDALKPLQVDTRGNTPPPLVSGIPLPETELPRVPKIDIVPPIPLASFERAAGTASSRVSPRIWWAGLGLAACLVLGVWASRPRPTLPPPAPVISAVALEPAPVRPVPVQVTSPGVRFHVDSDPSGATVSAGGRVLGRTPLTFTIAKGPDGSATAELLLSLKGFQPLTVDLGGPGPDVVIKQKLELATTRRPSARIVRYRQVLLAKGEPEGSTVKLAAPRLVEVEPTPLAPGPVLAALPIAPSAPPPPLPLPPKNVLPFVLDKALIKREAPRLSEVFKQTHRGGGVLNGMYRVCVSTEGRVSSVTAVKAIEGADDEIIAGIQEGWLYRPQAVPVCALYPVPVSIRD